MAEGNENEDFYGTVSALQEADERDHGLVGGPSDEGFSLHDLQADSAPAEEDAVVSEKELLQEIAESIDGACDTEDDNFWEALGGNRLESGATIDDGENDWLDTSRCSEPIELYSENFLGGGTGSGKISRIGDDEWHDTSGDEDGRFSGTRDELPNEAVRDMAQGQLSGTIGTDTDTGGAREYVSIAIEDEVDHVCPDTLDDDVNRGNDDIISGHGSPPFVDEGEEDDATPSAASHDGIGGPIKSQDDHQVPTTSCVEASTQTFFKQGFLKSFKEPGAPRKKKGRRPQSVPINPNHVTLGEQTDSGNVWDKVAQWTRRRRSKKPSLRSFIQGRGGPLMIPTQAPITISLPDNSNPTMIQAYVNFMYYICVSTRTLDNSKPTIKKVAEILQKAGFWTLAILSICYSIDLLKFYSIEFVDNGQLNDYVHLGFLIIYCITRFYSLMLHAFNSDKLKKMTDNMKNAQLGSVECKWLGHFAYALGGVSVLLAIMGSIFGRIPVHEWSWDYSVLVEAYKMSHTIFVWSATNYENVTNMLADEYALEITWKTVLLAIPRYLMTFCGSLQDFVLGDIFLSSAISLLRVTSKFVRDIESMPPETVNYTDFKQKWNEYQVIAQASDTFYETCGSLLTMYHIYNMLDIAVFLRWVMIKRAAHFLFLTTAVNVIKSLTTYVIATKISEKNQTCRNWVRHCAFSSLSRRKQKHKKLYMLAILMLDEMKDNPLGFGKDELLINKGFLITFLGMAASLFAMLAEYSGEAGGKGKC